MAFAVQITEVGEAEFPLLEVLRDTVFGDFGHVSHSTVADGLRDQRDLLMLMAHLEGNPVGFSAGYRRTDHAYYLNYMAMLRDYRRQGIGRQFIQQHEMFARSRGYQRIEFNTQNRFPGMMHLGASLGYRPIGMEQHDGTENDLVIRFGKSLLKPATVDGDLLAHLARGNQLVGLRRDESGNLLPLFSGGAEFRGAS